MNPARSRVETLKRGRATIRARRAQSGGSDDAAPRRAGDGGGGRPAAAGDAGPEPSLQAAPLPGRGISERRVDTVARIVGQELSRRDGLSVIVDNRPGGGGNIAARELLRAPADGHTILLASVGVLAINPFAMKDVGYAPQDFAPITLAVDFSNVIVVHPSVPARTLADYLALAKGPDGMTYGTSGVGSAGHLAGELGKSMTGCGWRMPPIAVAVRP